VTRVRRAPPVRIDYVHDWRDAPMAYWVHVEQGDAHWRAAEAYEPAAPMPHGKRGYAVLWVSIGPHELGFSSPAQLAEAIRVLAMKPLPTTRRLSLARAGGKTEASAGPNSHWLSRLPAALKSPKGRARVVEALRAAQATMVLDGERFRAPPPSA
jgi:hypothetical protein